MAKLFIVVFSLLGLISACVGQVIQTGQCDDSISVLTNFNATNYLGVWYDIESLPSTFQSGTCNTATYGLNDDGTLSIQNTQVIDAVLQFVTGSASSAEGVPTGTAKFNVSITSSSGSVSQTPYWVLDTDYTSFALVYSCRNVTSTTRQVNSWKLGRNKGLLPTDAIIRINNIIASVPALSLVSSQYIVRNHTTEGCSYFVDLDGQCNTTITGVANFNASRYLGTWYEVARYPQTAQTGQCNRAQYTAGASSDVFSVVNSQVTNEVFGSLSGEVRVTNQPGVLEVTLNVGGVPRSQYLYVLATDYDNYAFVYSCVNLDTNRRRIGSWKLSKSTNPLSAEANNAINAVIAATEDLNEAYYQATSQTDDACFYYPEFTEPPSSIVLPGSCDTSITGVANFDVTRYLGTWYEVARYPQLFQDGQCSRAQYTLNTTSGAVSVLNSKVNDETLGTISGEARLTNQSGVLEVTLDIGPVPTSSYLYVLATDYDNYALVYSCSNIAGNQRRVSSWKLSRSTGPLSAAANNTIDSVINATQGLKQEYYQTTSQDDAACFYYPEFDQPPSSIDLPGSCNTSITGVANFDVTRYLGTWYEVARYPQLFQDGECSRAQYTLNTTSGAVSVLNSKVNDETLGTISGEARLTNQSGVLEVTLDVGGVPVSSYLYVLATDYDNYALVYSCSNIAGNQRRVSSWKLSRSTGPLSAAANNTIDSVINATQGLKQEYYQTTSQDDAACFYYPEFDQPQATIVLPGPCNTSISGISGFDVNRYVGTWYEVARYPQTAQTGQCNRAQYTLGSTSGVVTVVNSQVTNESFGSISGQARVTSQPGVLEVTFTVGGELRTTDLYVLATDYDNYALAYSCVNLAGNQRQVGSWKLSRSQNALSAAANSVIDNVINSTQGLKQEYYQTTSQDDAACFYYPEFDQPQATIVLPGPCNTSIAGISGFDVNRYVGTWYEVARYPQTAQTGQCNRAQYTLGSTSGVVTVVNSQVTNESFGSISGQARVTSQPGVLEVTFTVGGELRTTDLYVLATDYDNYALAYSCVNVAGNQRQVGSWKLSRSQNALSAAANSVIDNVINSTQGLKQEYYQATSQDDAACFYYPEFDQPQATIVLPGPCNSSISGISGFDVNRYVGTWYEVARYPQTAQTGQCNRAQYTLGSTSGVVSVVNSQVTNESLGSISGEARVTNQPGVLEVTFTVGGELRTTDLYVLATDYSNYALAYSCVNVTGNQRQVGSWKLSRTRNALSAAANSVIDNVISSTQGLRQEYYQSTNQTDQACFHYPTQTGDRVIIPGQCDTSITGVANIDLSRFANGNWYQIQRYDAVGDSSCIGARLSLDGDYINVNTIEVIDGGAKVSEGTARISSDGSGKFTLSMSDIEGEEEIYILATDYDGFAIAYSCRNNGTENRQIGAWQLSRGRTMTAAGNAALNTLVAERQEFTLLDNYFKTISHEGNCPEPSSAFLFKSSIILIFVCTVMQLLW